MICLLTVHEIRKVTRLWSSVELSLLHIAYIRVSRVYGVEYVQHKHLGKVSRNIPFTFILRKYLLKLKKRINFQIFVGAKI
jgi:hypothetical protein